MSGLDTAVREALREELYATVPEMIRAALGDVGQADVFTSEELAAKWGCSRHSIDRLISSGDLPHITVPGVRGRLVRAVDAAAYLEQRACQQRRPLRAAG